MRYIDHNETLDAMKYVNYNEIALRGDKRRRPPQHFRLALRLNVMYYIQHNEILDIIYNIECN